MDVKEFYRRAYQEKFSNDMPFWLKSAAKEELEIFEEEVWGSIFERTEYLNSAILGQPVPMKALSFDDVCKDFSVLDFGCGELRLSEHLYKRFPNIAKRHACDLFKTRDYPKHLKRKLSCLNTVYTPSNSYLYGQQNTQGMRFDIIVSLGVDCHISYDKKLETITRLRNLLKENGKLIWQANRTDTIRGRMIQFQYRNTDFYPDDQSLRTLCKWYYKTPISRIYCFS